MEMILNRYQVQVYNFEGKMIHCSVYEGFTRTEAIENCKKELMECTWKESLVFPLKFFIAD